MSSRVTGLKNTVEEGQAIAKLVGAKTIGISIAVIIIFLAILIGMTEYVIVPQTTKTGTPEEISSTKTTIRGVMSTIGVVGLFAIPLITRMVLKRSSK